MNTLRKIAVPGLLAFLALSGSAQAGEIKITIRTSDPSAPRAASYDECSSRRYIRAPDADDCRPSGSRHRWHRSSWYAPVAARRDWYDHDDCRIVITRRVNAWGDLIEKRKKICG